MNDELILLIGGKYFNSPSPTLLLVPLLHNKYPDSPILIRDWQSPNTDTFFDILKMYKRIRIYAHSFGCFTTYLLTKWLKENYNGIEIILTLFDPVRWNKSVGLDLLNSLTEDSFAQVIDREPYEFDTNIVQADVFYRTYPIGPVTSECKFLNPNMQATYHKINGSHASIVNTYVNNN